MSEYLYRIWGDNDELLYIGISKSALKRFAEHMETQPWAAQARRQTIEHLDCDRAEALRIEAATIVSEKPKYNKVHNGENPRAPRQPKQKQTGWFCETCGDPAYYIQGVYEDRSWHCVCEECDLYPPGFDSGVYWFECTRIATEDEVWDWERHLGEKNWFNRRSWRRMIDMCRTNGAAIKASLNGNPPDRHPLIGKFVLTPIPEQLPDRWIVSRQGVVLAVKDDGRVEVGHFSWLDGSTSGRTSYGAHEMVEWRFFDDHKTFLREADRASELAWKWQQSQEGDAA